MFISRVRLFDNDDASFLVDLSVHLESQIFVHRVANVVKQKKIVINAIIDNLHARI
jgi:hypothetical protein